MDLEPDAQNSSANQFQFQESDFAFQSLAVVPETRRRRPRKALVTCKNVPATGPAPPVSDPALQPLAPPYTPPTPPLPVRPRPGELSARAQWLLREGYLRPRPRPPRRGPPSSRAAGLAAPVPRKGKARVIPAWGLVCDVAEAGRTRPGREGRGPPSRHLAAEGPGGRGWLRALPWTEWLCPSASKTRPWRTPPGWSCLLIRCSPGVGRERPRK